MPVATAVSMGEHASRGGQFPRVEGVEKTGFQGRKTPGKTPGTTGKTPGNFYFYPRKTPGNKGNTNTQINKYLLYLQEQKEMIQDYVSGNRPTLEGKVSRVEGVETGVEKYLSIKEAAEFLGKSEKTIRTYIKAGKLPEVTEESKYGPRYVIPLEALERLRDGIFHTPAPETSTLETSTLEDETSTPSRVESLVPMYDVRNLMLAFREIARAEVAAEVNELRTELVELRTKNAELQGRVDAVEGKVEWAVIELQEKRNRRPWWRRLLG